MRVLLWMLMISCVGCLSEPGEEDLAGTAEQPAADGVSPGQAAEDTATTTQASTAEGFVAGAGLVNDDFNDEGPVDSSNHRSSMATGLWQAILWADGAIETDGTSFDAADIDCDFGTNTTAATKSWQSTHGFTGTDVDGKAGPMTFGRAGENLTLFPAPDGSFSTVIYNGSHHDLVLIRKEGSGSINHAYQAKSTDSPSTLRIISYGFISSCSSSFWLG